jgi:hypothetical protein
LDLVIGWAERNDPQRLLRIVIDLADSIRHSYRVPPNRLELVRLD